MNVLKQFDEILTYIESNLLEEINMNHITHIAGCSGYAFQRMFSYIVGIPLSAYIRRRKMSNAGFEVLQNNEKIIAIAMKYGYQSSHSFNRAFQSIHGFPPSKAREKNKELVVYPRIQLCISISGNTSISYRIEDKEEMVFYGKSYSLTPNIENNFQHTPIFWKDFTSHNYLNKMCMDIPPIDTHLYGIVSYHEKQTSQYLIALKNNEILSSSYEQIIVSKQTWLIFSTTEEMPTAMIEMYTKFYQEWLPVSDYEYDNNTDIEVYPQNINDICEYELWLPIKKKEKYNVYTNYNKRY